MRNIILLAIVISTAILTPYAYSQVEKFELKPVVTAEDPVACSKANGRAALVADLDANGELASGWEAYCLTPSK